jgi:hypothetical protein
MLGVRESAPSTHSAPVRTLSTLFKAPLAANHERKRRLRDAMKKSLA